jgi:hypothetical protein
MALVAAGSGQAVQRELADDGSLLVPSSTRVLQAPRRTVRGAALGFDYRQLKRIPSRRGYFERENRCHRVLHRPRPMHPSLRALSSSSGSRGNDAFTSNASTRQVEGVEEELWVMRPAPIR